MSKPSWLYKPISNIQNIKNIQKECLSVFENHYSDAFGNRGFMFCYVDQDILKNECPTYTAYLKEIGLYDKWCRTVFIGTKTEKRLEDSPIHVDSEDWESRCYALNIPVVNCEDSYTVWYDVQEYDEEAYSGDDERIGHKSARGFKPQTSTEIGRLNSNIPAWINVAIPHRAENSNPNLRFLVSTRFYPEIHDFNFDQFSP